MIGPSGYYFENLAECQVPTFETSSRTGFYIRTTNQNNWMYFPNVQLFENPPKMINWTDRCRLCFEKSPKTINWRDRRRFCFENILNNDSILYFTPYHNISIPFNDISFRGRNNSHRSGEISPENSISNQHPRESPDLEIDRM